ncbi:7194_t:CDS:2 [Funneliformis caledonium]|uniref:7194_t:CDS:1 n=1 Tax=Funneliformis caledonium TaxID=1117310 RepID=A0A9N8Z5F7_9GLOM|nr:7194_t:CDS:2 [Funneliformis caledonium]
MPINKPSMETLRKPLICNGFVISQGSTFDYISMIKHLHYDYMLTSVESWCKNLVNSSGNNNVSMIIKVILRLFVDKSVELTSLFIWPNNVYLRHYNLNRYMELVEPEFNGLLKNLMSLHVETHSHYPSAKFLQKLSLIVRNVKKIHLRTPLLGLKGFPNDMEAGIAKNLCTLIQSQTKLEEFKLMGSFKFTPSFISSLSVHTDHLKSVALFETKIDEVDSWKVLTNCLNLERFEIINCVGLHSDFISLFYNVNNFKKLKWISMEKNQPNEINEELKTCAIHKYKDDLRFRLLKSGKVLNDICK